MTTYTCGHCRETMEVDEKHIADLEKKLALAEEANACFRDGLGQPIEYDWGGDDYGRPLYTSMPLIQLGYAVPLAFPDDQPRCDFSVLPNLVAFEEDRTKTHFTVRQEPDGALRISASVGPLAIEPWVTNVITVRIK